MSKPKTRRHGAKRKSAVVSSELVIPLKAIEDMNWELFEDGVEADLGDIGVTTLAAAYMQGRLDMTDEIKSLAIKAG